MSKIEVYFKTWCPYCKKAKELLESKGLDYEGFDIESDSKLVEEMKTRSKGHTVPQIFIDGVHIGGCDDLHALEASGELDKLINDGNSSNSINAPKNN